MISDLDSFTFVELPQESDKEEAENDGPEESIQVKALN